MAIRRLGSGWGLCAALLRTGLLLAAAGAVCGALSQALAQESLFDVPKPTRAPRVHTLPDRPSDKPSQPPAFAVPVEALGFSAPGPRYLRPRTGRVSVVVLEYNRLLFT